MGGCLIPIIKIKGMLLRQSKTILEYGFKEMNLHRIIATCQPENIPSYRVMKKIGMRREKAFLKNVFQKAMNGGMNIITLF